jgi:hypothetical protein
MKMPEPMIPPITIIVMSKRFSWRASGNGFYREGKREKPPQSTAAFPV